MILSETLILIMGLGFGIFDTRHVQDTSHVLENKKANNAVKHINLIIGKLIVPIKDEVVNLSLKISFRFIGTF